MTASRSCSPRPGAAASAAIGSTDRRRARSRPVIANLPGYPDNINRASDGTYWLALVGMRTPSLDLALKHAGLPPAHGAAHRARRVAVSRTSTPAACFKLRRDRPDLETPVGSRRREPSDDHLDARAQGLSSISAASQQPHRPAEAFRAPTRTGRGSDYPIGGGHDRRDLRAPWTICSAAAKPPSRCRRWTARSGPTALLDEAPVALTALDDVDNLAADGDGTSSALSAARQCFAGQRSRRVERRRFLSGAPVPAWQRSAMTVWRSRLPDGEIVDRAAARIDGRQLSRRLPGRRLHHRDGRDRHGRCYVANGSAQQRPRRLAARPPGAQRDRAASGASICRRGDVRASAADRLACPRRPCRRMPTADLSSPRPGSISVAEHRHRAGRRGRSRAACRPAGLSGPASRRADGRLLAGAVRAAQPARRVRAARAGLPQAHDGRGAASRSGSRRHWQVRPQLLRAAAGRRR